MSPGKTPRATVVVLAKAPRAGRSKTRLTPPWTPQEAALLAEAALVDTLAAARGTASVDVVLALDGRTAGWCPPDLAVLPQRGRGLAARIGAALADARGLRGRPVLLVGMDTPQLTPLGLTRAVDLLLTPGTGAVLGDAADGGWWALGVHAATESLLLGVAMSTATTGAATRRRLAQRGLCVRDLAVLRDVDTALDAEVVAATAPATRFAAELRRLHGLRRPPGGLPVASGLPVEHAA